MSFGTISVFDIEKQRNVKHIRYAGFGTISVFGIEKP